jgi:DNA polymerase III alpha subunit (gram-positive type)
MNKMDKKDKNYVFYDLETNGLDYYTTGILQISILNDKDNILLDQYVYPFDNRIDCTDIHNIDQKKLIDNNAISTKDLCTLIKNIIRKEYDREDVYFIAYNNFGYDQIILENNFKISDIRIPSNWYFVDLFPIIKDIYTDIKPNYKLKTVYEFLFNNIDEKINFHSALDDTRCVLKIFKIIKDKEEIIKKYTRSLLSNNEIFNFPITSFYGYHKSMNFENKGINTIGDMFEIFKLNDKNMDKFVRHLQTKLNVYSLFYINNIIKQINIINYLII